MNPVNVTTLISLFNQLERRGVKYGLGAKADDKHHNPRSTGRLTTPPDTIDEIDCSGFSRYALYQATGCSVTIPEGSQEQMQWFLAQKDKSIVKTNAYLDISKSAATALFISFIKIHTNGCGPVGHVWFTIKDQQDATPETLESHGGAGVDSRAWNTLVLRSEVFVTFQLPTA